MACSLTEEGLFASETKQREDEQINKEINQHLQTQPTNVNIPTLTRFQLFLRASSKKDWTRIEDECLLLYLQEFSRKIISKTTDVTKLVDNLDSTTNGTRGRVRNVLNEFLMNSSEQFIENTVEEEDFSVRRSTNKLDIKSSAQKQKDIYDNYVKAISYGLEFLDETFITIPIKCIDDSTKIEDVILAPKKEREHRPLPPLIGSTNFFRVESIDLKESFPSDEDGSEDDKNFASGSSDSDEGEYILLDSDEEERIKWNFSRGPNVQQLEG